MSIMSSVLTVVLLIQFSRSQEPHHISEYYEYDQPFTATTSSWIQMPYVLNKCTRTGNHIGTGGVGSYGRCRCSNAGSYIMGPCTTGDSGRADCEDGSMTACTISNYPSLSPTAAPTTTLCPNTGSTTSTNYVQLSLYCGDSDEQQPPQCPNNSTLFPDVGVVRFVTDICTNQSNGDYLMATCNNETAEIGIYSDDNCVNNIGTHANYTRSCQKYARPEQSGLCKRLYRRVSGCFVNDLDILLATLTPTSFPSTTPTQYPTDHPTKYPSSGPSISPTQYSNAPSKNPTAMPSGNPSVAPTDNPSVTPTENPITARPTVSPTVSPTQSNDPEQTVLGAESILKGLNNIALIYIVCVILFVFYLFICGYIWCNERRKRGELKSKFNSGEDKEERKEYLRKKNLQRRLELQGVEPRQAKRMVENGNYQQINQHLANNGHNMNRRQVPLNQQLMSEGR